VDDDRAADGRADADPHRVVLVALHSALAADLSVESARSEASLALSAGEVVALAEPRAVV
jgi:hypothetical protein